MATMFELPEAKRVRRAELFEHGESATETSSRGSSPAGYGSAQAPRATIHFEYELVDAAAAAAAATTHISGQAPHGTGHEQNKDAAADDGDDGFEFRLFASSSKSIPPPIADTSTGADRGIVTAATTRINIRSPSPPGSSSDGRFTTPNHPSSYYFADAAQAWQSAASAVSGSDVLARSKCKWPGTSLPWRVISLPNPASRSKTRRTRPPPTTTTTKSLGARSPPRPNKKRRILLRTRARAVAAKAEADQEKRTRRNREKKVKRKEKEKRAKQAGKDVPLLV